VLGCVGEEMLFDREDRSKKLGDKIKEMKKAHKKVSENGISDSIRTCLNNRNETNEKMLKLLVQSFEKINTANTRSSTRVNNSIL